MDEAGKPTGVAKTKDEIIRAGDWRRVVHVWVVDDQDDLLIQRRAFGRGIFDGLWDMSVGGGVASGEASIDAARREVFEELGLDLSADCFIPLGTWKIPPKTVGEGRIMKDFSDTFLVRVPTLDTLTLSLGHDEVSAVDALSLGELYKSIQNLEFRQKWVPHGANYYRGVIKKIRAQVR